MDQDIKEPLKKIQLHLKALVNLQIIKMAEQVARDGGFRTKEGGQDLDAAGDYQESLIERAYKDFKPEDHLKNLELVNKNMAVFLNNPKPRGE